MDFYNKPPLSKFLMHYGVKGMKWGVRRTPEQLGHKKAVAKRSGSDTIVADAIASGLVSKTVNREKQMRHTREGHAPGRSYIDGGLDFAQTLVDRLSGTGDAVTTKAGEWLRKEKVENPYIIGTHVGRDGMETKTNKAMIVYSKTGTHIYPRKEED
ncbi:hypothetical protein D1159_05620 [Pseudoflavonifractor sp. 524-17]|uniref:polymorphic toxin type 50 domain-containing protein n=1 Tax=Pseudoflavonifractor sp. 524-17 TaxID=2304577 RepID=UPI001379BA63|nr:polymorphic toxin type 50 domain-containing protein [Pseudoflavonifractor sp. 524-17]NCE64076.1 hypothetical protein [Pseudoflavonifractor sp. 524-17]